MFISCGYRPVGIAITLPVCRKAALEGLGKGWSGGTAGNAVAADIHRADMGHGIADLVRHSTIGVVPTLNAGVVRKQTMGRTAGTVILLRARDALTGVIAVILAMSRPACARTTGRSALAVGVAEGAGDRAVAAVIGLAGTGETTRRIGTVRIRMAVIGTLNTVVDITTTA